MRILKLYELTLHEIRDKIRQKEISAKDLLDSVFGRIDTAEDSISAYISLSKDEAYKKAKEIDAKIAAGEEPGDLAGIPMALKDNICSEGIKTTCASKMLDNFVPPYDAEVYRRLRAAGAVLVGKANMDEFAMGSSTEKSYYKITKNPWNLGRVPGGSSGGSAASVAAGEAFFSLGTDTGGSIRQPAAFCGLVGLKPTYGAVSRYGVVSFGSSLEQAGPITKDVEDCAIVLNHLYGHDDKDSTSLDIKYPDFTKGIDTDVKGMKIGLPKEYYGKGIDPEVKSIVSEAVKIFEKLGAHVEEVSLPYSEYAVPVYYIVASAEASSNLARFDGVRYGHRAKDYTDLEDMYVKSRSQGFGEEVKLRVMLGTYVLGEGFYDAYYDKALKVRALIKQDFDRVFEKYDILISPTTPTTAFRLGEKQHAPLSMHVSDICTVPASIAGIPAMSIPCGFSKEGLPIGMQIMGKRLGETEILRAAYNFEKNTNFAGMRPVL